MMLLSIIIPFYKGNRYINRLLQCLAINQQYLASCDTLEIIIVNDSPNEEIVINPILKEKLDIKVFINNRNSGIHKTRVEGLKYANADYVLMIDQDDLLTDDALKKGIVSIKKYNSDAIIFNAYRRKVTNTQINSDYLSIPHHLPHFFMTSIFMYLFVDNPIISPGHVFIRKDAIPIQWENNILHKNGSDDMLLWIMMIQKGLDIRYIDDVIYYHMENGENFSFNIEKMIQSDRMVEKILSDNKILSSFQVSIMHRKNTYKYFYYKDKLKAISLYPDIFVIRASYKLLSKVLYVLF